MRCLPHVGLLLGLAATPLAAQADRHTDGRTTTGRPHASATADSLPVALFDYDLRQPLALEDSLVGEEEGVRIHAVSYASPAGGRVTGFLFAPARPGPHAGIVYAHGTGAGARTQHPRAIYLARHGAVVLVPDAPYVRAGGDFPRFTVQDSVEQVQHVRELRRAFDVLAARADVDTARLAFVGRSHGGAIGALLAGVEPRPRAWILIVADAGLVRHMRDWRDPADGRTVLDGLDPAVRERWLAAMTPIEPVRFFAQRRSLAPVLFQSAERDEAVPRSAAEALHRATRGQHEVRWYDAGHRLDVPSFVDQLTWLHQVVGTTPPGPDAAAGPKWPPRQPAR